MLEEAFIAHQKEKIEKRLQYYEGLSETGSRAKSPEYIVEKKKRIPRLREALQHITEGVYGICVGCSKEISRSRLIAIPGTTRCTSCQRHAERTNFQASRS